MLGEELGHLVISRHDLLIKVASFGVLERQITGDHSIKDYSGRPDICLETVVAFALYHLLSILIKNGSSLTSGAA